MNIIEAIKSGKRFRHKGTQTWCNANSGNDLLSGPYEWFVSGDWEVEEKEIVVTDSSFEAAADRAARSFPMYNPPHICEYLDKLKKELGL